MIITNPYKINQVSTTYLTHALLLIIWGSRWWNPLVISINFQDKRDHKNNSALSIQRHKIFAGKHWNCCSITKPLVRTLFRTFSHWFEIKTQQVGFPLKAHSYQKVTCIMKQVGLVYHLMRLTCIKKQPIS